MDKTFTSTVEIEADPRRPMSRADRMVRQEALMSLRDLAKPLYDASQAVDRLGDQLLEAEDLLEDHEGASESITEELSAIQEELSEISTALTEVRRNAGIAGASARRGPAFWRGRRGRAGRGSRGPGRG